MDEVNCRDCKFYSELHRLSDGVWGTCSNESVRVKVRGSDNAYGADEVAEDFGCKFFETSKLVASVENK